LFSVVFFVFAFFNLLKKAKKSKKWGNWWERKNGKLVRKKKRGERQREAECKKIREKLSGKKAGFYFFKKIKTR